MIWVQAGFAMTILSASIKAIPDDIVEAARLDGVGGLQMFRYITVPSIRPSLIVVLTTISIATLKVFDIVRTTTGGNFDTSVLAYEFYAQSFRSVNQGLGAALAVLIFVLVHADRRLQRPSDAQAGGTMTTADRPDVVGRRPSSPRRPPPSSAHKALTLAVGVARRDRHRGPLDDPDRSACSSRRSGPRSDIKTQRLVDRLHRPDFTLDNYDEVLNGSRHATWRRTSSTRSSSRSRRCSSRSARDAGGVRVRLDELPGPRLPVRRDLRAADRADPGDADPAAQPLRRPPFSLTPAAGRRPAAASTRSGSRTRSSRCRWRSTCCTTSCARSPAS